MIVRVAGLLVAVALFASVTTARYSAELGLAKPLKVKVIVVAPLTPLLLLKLLNETPLLVEICH